MCKFAVEVTMENDAPLILEVNNPHVPGQRLRSRLETLNLDGLPVPKGTVVSPIFGGRSGRLPMGLGQK